MQKAHIVAIGAALVFALNAGAADAVAGKDAGKAKTPAVAPGAKDSTINLAVTGMT